MQKKGPMRAVIAQMLKRGGGKGCAMLEIAKKFHDLLQKKIGVAEEFGEIIYGALVVAALIIVAVGINWVVQRGFQWLWNRSGRLKKSKWHNYLLKRKVGHHVLLLVPGLIIYSLPYLFYE